MHRGLNDFSCAVQRLVIAFLFIRKYLEVKPVCAVQDGGDQGPGCQIASLFLQGLPDSAPSPPPRESTVVTVLPTTKTAFDRLLCEESSIFRDTKLEGFLAFISQ